MASDATVVSSGAGGPAAAAGASEAGRRRSPRQSERRHLTVLFCDVVDSTGLAARLDPEEFAELMDQYAGRTGAVIERYGGLVAKLMGDEVLAVFGYPTAHEDDAERAVLAALGCLEANGAIPVVSQAGTAEHLRVRLGLHTGLAVVGVLAPFRGDDVAGAVPAIASRLQSEAAPGEILVSPETRRLAGDRFEYQALEPRRLKGTDEVITPYRVSRELAARTRFELRSTGRRALLLGRSGEIGRLRANWAAAAKGGSEPTVITGPAGIGKSRLTNAFIETIQARGPNIHVYQCSPHHSGTPLHPVVTRMRQELDALAEASAEGRRGALHVWLGRVRNDDERSVELLSELLALGPGERLTRLDMSPRQQMEESLLMLADCIVTAARREPQLLLFEDLHWADPTTMRFVELCNEKFRREPVVLLATYRSEQAGALGSRFWTEIRLDRLAAEDATELARTVAHPHEIPPETVRTIVERGDGVPLFVEELTKSAVESMTRGKPGTADGGGGDAVVPATLVDSLSARLDALPGARRLAQVAAAIGREAPQDLLRAVCAYPPESFRAAVAELAGANVIRSVPQSASEPLVFSHALIQEVAYQLMLKKDRRAVHGTIVEVLERDSPEICRQQPEILARHCEEAGQAAKAARFLIDAGVGAVRHAAYVEALTHLRRARDLVTNTPGIARPQALALELEIESTVGTPLISVEGYTSKETVRAFERAEEISIELDDGDARFQALFGLWGHRWMAGHLDLSVRLADEMLEVASHDASPERMVLAHRCAGSSHWIMGGFEPMRLHFGEVKRLTLSLDTRQLADRYAVCPLVVALVLGGYGTWLDGDREAGRAGVAAGMDRAYAMNHAYSKALAHSMAGGIAMLEEDFAELARQAQALRAVSEDRRFAYWLGYAETFEGVLLAKRGELEEGRRKILGSIATFDAMGVLIHRTMQLALLSDVEARRGYPAAAARYLAEAETVGRRTGERQWFGEIARRRALLAKDQSMRE